MHKMVRRGFTLIELLVVIAIIAILAAILFPVFAKARSAAKTSTCLSNLKQMGIAFTSYATDYEETLPPSWWVYVRRGDPIGWENNVINYLGGSKAQVAPDAAHTNKTGAYQLFICPELNIPHSYCRNDWCGEAKITNVGDAVRVIHIFDLPKYPDKGYFNGWNAYLRSSDDADWSNDTEYNYPEDDATMLNKTSFNYKGGMAYWLRFPGVHNGRANILFIDSHVASFNTWDPNKMTFRWGGRTQAIHRS